MRAPESLARVSTVPGAARVAVSLGAAGEFMSLAFSSRSPSSSSSSKSPPSELTTMPSSSSQTRRGDDIISLSPTRCTKIKTVSLSNYEIYLIFKSTHKSGGRFGIFYTTRQRNKDGRPYIYFLTTPPNKKKIPLHKKWLTILFQNAPPSSSSFLSLLSSLPFQKYSHCYKKKGCSTACKLHCCVFTILLRCVRDSSPPHYSVSSSANNYRSPHCRAQYKFNKYGYLNILKGPHPQYKIISKRGVVRRGGGTGEFCSGHAQTYIRLSCLKINCLVAQRKWKCELQYTARLVSFLHTGMTIFSFWQRPLLTKWNQNSTRLKIKLYRNDKCREFRDKVYRLQQTCAPLYKKNKCCTRQNCTIFFHRMRLKYKDT